MGLLDDVVLPAARVALSGTSRLLSEGAGGPDVVGQMRGWWAADKESAQAKMRRGTNDRIGTNKVAPAMQGGGYEALADDLRIEQDLVRRFADYEEMDDYPEVASAIDIYADDSTIEDMIHETAVWVVSKDKMIAQLLMHLLHKQLRINEDIWPLARTVTKYGNGNGELLVTKDQGVIGVNWLPAPTVRRVETHKGQLIGYVQDDTGKFRMTRNEFGRIMTAEREGRDVEELPDGVSTFEPWEMVHWRLRSKHMRSTYGHSVLEPVRWVWRRLVMLEDTMLVYKLTRAPARFAFYVDVGDLPPEQAKAYVHGLRNDYRKRKILRQGLPNRMDFRMNPLGPDDDIWVPSRSGKDSTRIDVLSGPDYQAIDDVVYFREKLLAGIKVPKSYIGLEDNQNRATLSQLDVRFARTVLRIQRELRNGIRQICRVHLAALGIDPDKVEWDVRMSTPSSIFELAQLEVMNARADLADRLVDRMPKDWILQQVMKLGADDATAALAGKKREIRDDARFNAEVQASILRDYPEAAMMGMGMGMGGQQGMGGAGGAGGMGGAPGGTAEELRVSAADRMTAEQRLDKYLEDLDRRLMHRVASLDEARDAAKDIRRIARDLDSRMRRTG